LIFKLERPDSKFTFVKVKRLETPRVASKSCIGKGSQRRPGDAERRKEEVTRSLTSFVALCQGLEIENTQSHVTNPTII
jgi:hypothetical protein